jgi:hypothetical protein
VHQVRLRAAREHRYVLAAVRLGVQGHCRLLLVREVAWWCEVFSVVASTLGVPSTSRSLACGPAALTALTFSDIGPVAFLVTRPIPIQDGGVELPILGLEGSQTCMERGGHLSTASGAHACHVPAPFAWALA